jgi:hypothetical protein
MFGKIPIAGSESALSSNYAYPVVINEMEENCADDNMLVFENLGEL